MGESDERRTWRLSRGDISRTAGPRLAMKKTVQSLDEFDIRLRRSIVAAFVGGSIIHFMIVNTVPGQAHGGAIFANLMVLLGLISALLIPYLPWDCYGRDVFSVVLLYAALLLCGLIYSTGGPDSPFAPTFLLITISAGLYHTPRLALVIAVSCALLGFLPVLYAIPGP